MPSPQLLDLTTSLQMAKIASTVYGRHVPSSKNTNKANTHLTEVSEFTTQHVRCTVGYWHSGTRASVVIAFRGSSNSAEWANNVPLAKWEPASSIIAGCVHAGFKQSLSQVWTDIAKTVQHLSQAHLPELLNGYACGRSVPLCCVGHSRGGALAVLAGLHALTTFVLPVRVYTFGAPRVGDRDFAEAYNMVFEQGESVHWRFEKEGDPVPVFPFLLQARHTGSLAYLRTEARTVQILGVERHPGKRVLCSVSTKLSQHHRMTAYLQFLSQAVVVETNPARAS